MAVVKDIVGKFRRQLGAPYGGRLRQRRRFGSNARGDVDDESDLDIFVVLDQVDDYAGEVDRTSEIIGWRSIRHGISRVFVSEKEWQHGDTVFLQIVREEAIPL